MVDYNSPMFRLGGSVYTGTSNGSITSNIFAQGTVSMWIGVPDTFDPSRIFPDVTISGNTLSWTFTGTGTKVGCTIYFGVK